MGSDHGCTLEADSKITGQSVATCVTDPETMMPSHVIAHAFAPFLTTEALGQSPERGLWRSYRPVPEEF
jgi:hypothetical protein